MESGQGRIIATSLANYAMPLIRYDTDDIGIVGADPCPCGRPYPLLQEICGRSGDFLYTPEGRAVHSLLFAYIFDELPWVKEYQVVQERLDRITIRVIPDRRLRRAQAGQRPRAHPEAERRLERGLLGRQPHREDAVGQIQIYYK